MTLKSDVTRAAYSPEADTAPALSEKIESGLNAPDAVTKAAAEAIDIITDLKDTKQISDIKKTKHEEEKQQDAAGNVVTAQIAKAHINAPPTPLNRQLGTHYL